MGPIYAVAEIGNIVAPPRTASFSG